MQLCPPRSALVTAVESSAPLCVFAAAEGDVQAFCGEGVLLISHTGEVIAEGVSPSTRSCLQALPRCRWHWCLMCNPWRWMHSRIRGNTGSEVWSWVCAGLLLLHKLGLERICCSAGSGSAVRCLCTRCRVRVWNANTSQAIVAPGSDVD